MKDENMKQSNNPKKKSTQSNPAKASKEQTEPLELHLLKQGLHFLCAKELAEGRTSINGFFLDPTPEELHAM